MSLDKVMERMNKRASKGCSMLASHLRKRTVSAGWRRQRQAWLVCVLYLVCKGFIE